MRRIVVEGCGQWAMQYFDAIKRLVGPGDGVFFTYDSTFGLDIHAERLPAHLFVEYLQATLRNVQAIQAAGFACEDVKDTLFRLQGRPYDGRKRLPRKVDVVFIVTPDSTHCDVAEYWLRKARWVFVEKPFDVSAARIERFCQELNSQSHTQVFAVDHYFVRCNQAAADRNYVLNCLLTTDGSGAVQGDLESFEFRMTEPPLQDRSSIRERALSLQEGMVFDMGSHALPPLLPFIDLASIRTTRVWAGVSEALRDILFGGAESFSKVEVCGSTRGVAGKPSSSIEGEFVIGKDIGKGPEKYLLLKGPRGKVRFDLVSYCVYHEQPNGGKRKPIVPLHENWVRFFVKEVVEGRIPAAVEMFRPEGALDIVRFLEEWRGMCQSGKVHQLSDYKPGEDVSALNDKDYRIG